VISYLRGVMRERDKLIIKKPKTMLVFTVSKGLVKEAHQAIINSNLLSGVFYQINQKFILTNQEDFKIVKKLLKKELITPTLKD